MKSKKKTIAIFITSIIMLTILFTICSNIYKVYAGSLPTGTIMGFDNINSGGVAGGPAGTLQVNGNQVYCMNEGANFSSNLGSSLAAVQAQAAGKSGTAKTLAEAEAAAKAASNGQKFDVKLAKLESCSRRFLRL